jgi:hypothetical protein
LACSALIARGKNRGWADYRRSIKKTEQRRVEFSFRLSEVIHVIGRGAISEASIA